jgi:Glu-tRNA(Gln) amidotransferase subunit E-like FAD-binding protein
MKKELFEQWFNSYGEDLAKNLHPLNEEDFADNDEWEIELRKLGKCVFSNTYDLIYQYFTNNLMCVSDDIYAKIRRLNNSYDKLRETLKKISVEKNKIKKIMDKLYDDYLPKKTNESSFNEMRSYFGNRLNELKNSEKFIEYSISEIKSEIKSCDLLLVSD